MDSAWHILGVLGRFLLSAISEAAAWAYWSRKAEDDLLPGVSPATYGRRQRKVTNLLAALGAIQFWGAVLAVVVLLVIGIYLVPDM